MTLFSFSSLSAIRVASSAYLRLLIFLLAILIPACDSSSPAFHMMYSVYTLNNQGNKYTLDIFLSKFWTSLLFMSGFNCCFLTHIQVSQETGKVVWYSHLLKNSAKFVVIYSQRFLCNQWSRSRCLSGSLLLFRWSNRCWQFDLWFLCLFWIQLEHLEFVGLHTVEA